MVFPVVGGTQDTSYNIDNSLRFNPGDNAYLNKTPSSEGNKRTFTLSFWAKICPDYGSDTSTNNFYTARNSDGMTSGIQQINGGYIQAFIYDDTGGEGYKLQLVTNAVYRDVTAWYHIVLAVDTTQGTASNRAKLYVNGSQVTSFSTETYPDQNFDSHINDDVPHYMGNKDGSNDDYDGYLAEFYLLDGTQSTPSSFGKTDSNGVWVPIKATGLSFGTNGFFMEFQQTGTSANASGKGADTSGQGNHYDDNNMTAEDITTDTPTNNFCTVNSLGGDNSSKKWTFSEGNTQIQQNDNGSWRATGSTMAVSKGKWYWEVEFDAGDMSEIFVGVHDSEVSLEGTNRWVNGSTLFYNHNGGEIRQDGTNTSNDYGVLTAGDILGVALNMDDNQITFYDNGSAIASNFGLSSYITGFAMPTFLSDSNDIVYKVNFGNAPFSISSGNADANGYGNFEYAVPTNYYSLCTKNLAEYG